MRDRNLLFGAAFLRALATGMVSVLLGIYLAKLGFEAARIGLVVAAGLAGGAAAALLVTLGGNRLKRRLSLLVLALLGAAGGLVFAVSSDPGVIAVAAFLGMVNGMGRDRGASLVFDQAILPATTTDGERTRVFVWYNVLQDSGHAIGGLLAGLPVLLRIAIGVPEVAALRLAIGAYAVLTLGTAAVYLRLSPTVEAPDGPPTPRVTPATRRILWRIGGLFAIDSLAGGLLTTALLSYYFFERFGAGEAAIGALFFGARVLNALSHLGAGWLARRFGLVNTMVFTHVPSSLLLATVAFAPSFLVASILFLLREGLVEMDVPTRQSYVMALVRPEERTIASGVTHLVRIGAWAVGPSLAGVFMQGAALAAPLLVGAGMKIVYDGLLYAAFRRIRPPEEMA
jgi:MFS family permease